jgi:hypothetical protein
MNRAAADRAVPQDIAIAVERLAKRGLKSLGPPASALRRWREMPADHDDQPLVAVIARECDRA